MQFTHPTSAVCFCGTILTVARTGRYPASLVFREPGLSSVFQFAGILQPPRLLFPNSSVKRYLRLSQLHQECGHDRNLEQEQCNVKIEIPSADRNRAIAFLRLGLALG